MSATEASPPKISVCVPAYNVAEYLSRCMESLLAQTLPADEILVIDDGSRDKSAELAAARPGVTLAGSMRPVLRLS